MENWSKLYINFFLAEITLKKQATTPKNGKTGQIWNNRYTDSVGTLQHLKRLLFIKVFIDEQLTRLIGQSNPTSRKEIKLGYALENEFGNSSNKQLKLQQEKQPTHTQKNFTTSQNSTNAHHHTTTLPTFWHRIIYSITQKYIFNKHL